MSNFVASNGVELDWCGGVISTPGDIWEANHEARKEFYQHLRDKELGQTREGDIVVRPLGDDEVLVWDETTGESEKWYRHEISAYKGSLGHDEAKRYFEAHPEPEPKPWHSATEGEVWVLEFGGDKRAYARTSTLFVRWETPSLLPTDTGIKGGYRIWPEGDSDG